MGVLAFGPHVLDRADDSPAEEVGPPLVDRRPGEEWIARRGRPAGEYRSHLRLAADRRLGAEQVVRLDRLALGVGNDDGAGGSFLTGGGLGCLALQRHRTALVDR